MVIQKTPRWRRQPAHRPTQILDAALLVFGETGVANATLDEVATRAGVSKGTIYLYFANKEELFRQTISHALAKVKAEAKPAVFDTATNQLRDSIAAQWGLLTSEAGSTANRLVLAEQWQFPDVAERYATEVVTGFVEELSGTIRRGIASGEFRELDPLVAARNLAALAVQSAAWHATGGAPALTGKTSAVVLREITEFYLQSILQPDAAFPQADGASDLRGALNN